MITSAILLVIFSFLVITLIAPSLYWHVKHRNLGASFAIAWILVMNLIIFTNAIIWRDDDMSDVYQGKILCDIQVRLQIASQVAFPASFACILRALAKVMDIKRMTLITTKSEKRRELAINLLCCIFFPCLQMLFHYFVQARRYCVFSVSGCNPTAHPSWVTVLLIYVPPVLWDLVCVHFAVLITIRLYKYRRDVHGILESYNTNRSRFLRLFLLCLLWIVASIPIQAYTFYNNLVYFREPYSWEAAHDPEQINQIILLSTDGVIMFDRFIWLGTGFAIFLFFGLGRDSMKMYASWVKALKLDKLLPRGCLRYRSQRSNGTDSVSTWRSDAELLPDKSRGQVEAFQLEDKH